MKSIDEIAKFLVPLIDLTTCDRTSLTNLKRNHREIIDKLEETGRPVLLTINGQTILLCDAKLYFDLENRRQSLFAQFRTLDEVLAHTCKMEIVDPRLAELENEQADIARLQSDIKEEKWRVKNHERKLNEAVARVAALTAELGISNRVTGQKKLTRQNSAKAK